MNLTTAVLDARVQSAALAFTCAWLAGAAVRFFRDAREELSYQYPDPPGRNAVLELWYAGEVIKAWCLITLLAALWPVEACAHVDEMAPGWRRTLLLTFANTWFAITLVSVPVSLYGCCVWATT
jgi:hypothetical protein